ncbi:MAG: hypothetical protein ACXVFV_03500 [Mycobacteriales bacterium]
MGADRPQEAGRAPVGLLLDRRPWVVLLVFSLLAWRGTDHGLAPTDYGFFQPAGRALVELHWGAVFADRSVQAGPLELLLFGVFDGVARVLRAQRTDVGLAADLLLCATNCGLALWVVRRLCEAGARRTWTVLVACLLALVYGALCLDAAHPTHALIALCWFAACDQAQRHRPARCGVLLAVACGLDSWGALGCGALLVLPGLGAKARAAGVLVAGTALFWLPFVLTRSFHSGDMTWVASRGSLPAVLLGPGAVPWSYRLAQGLVVALAGAATARVLMGSRHLRWLLPAVVICARLATDPLSFDYYGKPLVILLVATVAAAVVPALPARRPESEAEVRTLLSRCFRSPEAPAAAALLLLVALAPVAGPLVTHAPVLALLGLAVWRGRQPELPGSPGSSTAAVVAHRPVDRSLVTLRDGWSLKARRLRADGVTRP